MSVLRLCLLALLWPAMNVFAQSPRTNIRSLTVGDTMPDIELTNIINYPVSKIRLSELKGKVVILDFWGRYCPSCISALIKMDSLQQDYNEEMQVIPVSDFKTKQDLLTMLNKHEPIKYLQLPHLLSNKLLEKYFPHITVSHLVWIDKNRIIRGITGSEYVTRDNIKKIINNTVLNWPIKKDVLEQDNSKPLLGIIQKNIKLPSFLYYSALTAHTEGVRLLNGTHIDSARKVSITNFYNASLLTLCHITLEYRSIIKRNQFILNVKDTSRFVKGKQEYYSEWAKKNTYCYSLQMPMDVSPKKLQVAIQQDLTRWLAVLGIQVRRDTLQNKFIVTERQCFTY